MSLVEILRVLYDDVLRFRPSEPVWPDRDRIILSKGHGCIALYTRECDVVCLPTRYGEGIPRILIEAAATALASVVSDHPGCRAVVEDGVTGQVLSARAGFEMSRKLSAAVVGYLDDPDLLARHKQAAYLAFQSREFSQDACVARFTELLGWRQDVRR